jgi:uracil-DNA glycosylase
MTEIEYFCNWSKVIDFNLLHKALDEIKRLNIKDLCPSYKNIFKAFNLCDYNNLKVILLGQDPYSQRGISTGVAFANNNDVKQVSPSLKVLLKSARKECEPPYDLVDWCNQGILPLNASLTTMVGKTGVHSWIWRPFVSSLLHKVSISDRALVFILLGNDAQSFENVIYKEGNFILKEKHPSWYARNNVDMPDKVFRETETILKDYRNFELIW